MFGRIKTITGISLLFLIFIVVISVWNPLKQTTDDNTRLYSLTSHPPLLRSNNQEVAVNFKVYLKPGPGIKSHTIQLQQKGGKTYVLNDAGKHGDYFADDSFYGANINLDISGIDAEECLSFNAIISEDRLRYESPPYALCVSGLPTRVAASNLSKEYRLNLEANAVAVANELLLRFVEGISEKNIEALARELNAEITGYIPAHRLYQFKIPRVQSGDELMAQVNVINRHHSVEAASPNLVAFNAMAHPNDASYSTAQHGLQKIFTDPGSSKSLWGVPGTSGGPTIIVLDSGVFYGHEELDGIMLNCASIPDPVATPFTFHSCGTADADGASSDGHGTRVIGVIAAERNNAVSDVINIAGIVSSSPIISVKGPSAPDKQENADGLQTIAGLIEELEDVTYLPASKPIVVNLSRNLGGDPALPAVQALCTAANNLVTTTTPGERAAILVNSAGNNNDNVDSDPVVWAWPIQCKIPSSSLSSNVASDNFLDLNNKFLITVGNSVSCASTDTSCSEDTRYADPASGSNFGSLVDVFAPGTNVLTPHTDITMPAGTRYSVVSGNSLSAPLVTGAVAIMLDCGVPVDEISPSLKAGPLVSIPYPGDPAGIPAGSSPVVNIFTAMKEFYNSTTHGYGPLVPTFSHTMSSSELPVGTSAGEIVGTLGLSNALGPCNQVTYSVSGTDFTISLNNLELSNNTNLTAGTTLTATLTAEDAYGRTNSIDVDFAVVTDPPSGADVDVVLVLDRSGSMFSSSATGDSKLLAMQQAANQFVTTIAADERHRLGLVQFHSVVESFSPTHAFDSIDTDNQSSAATAVNNMMAGGATNIIEAVAAAANMVNATPASPRKVVVLFTDGKHNIPHPLSPTDLSAALGAAIDNVNPGIDFYSIGLGTSIEDEALNLVANDRDGYHVNEQDLDPITAGKNFTDVAVDVIGDVAIFDPIFNIRAGKSEILNVPVTLNDTSLTFMTRWETAKPDQIRTVIKPPLGGCDISHPGTNRPFQFLADYYYMVRVELPFRCNGQMSHSGNWKIIVSGTKILEREERVNVTTYASSEVKLESKVVIAENQIAITALLPELTGYQFKQAKFSAGIKTPLPDSGDSLDQDKLGSNGAGIIPEPPGGFRGFIPIEMIVDQKQSSIAHGNYTRLSQNGLYQIHLTVEALDQNGQKIRRETRTSVYFKGKSGFNWIWPIAIIGVLILVSLIYRQPGTERKPGQI